MYEHDFSDEIPDAANAIEILVRTVPVSGRIEIRRAPDDDAPLVMADGATTIMGVPERRRLYVTKLVPTTAYTLELLRWIE